MISITTHDKGRYEIEDKSITICDAWSHGGRWEGVGGVGGRHGPLRLSLSLWLSHLHTISDSRFDKIEFSSFFTYNGCLIEPLTSQWSASFLS